MLFYAILFFYSILFYSILFYSILFYSFLGSGLLYITYEVLLIIYNEPGVILVHRLHMGLYPLYKPGGEGIPVYRSHMGRYSLYIMNQGPYPLY